MGGQTVVSGYQQRSKKDEDVVFHQRCSGQQTGTGVDLDVFAVCDGHNGPAAAQHCREVFVTHLLRHFPARPCPEDLHSAEGEQWAETVRRCITIAFLQTDQSFMEKWQTSGATMTVAVLVGQVLTVANVGDSNAYLDTGVEIMAVSSEHRVQTHKKERERLKNSNSYIAPISCYLDGPAAPGESGHGPLRHWPGGLCVSRAIGDSDAGPLILAWPSIKQVVVPEAGARLLIASDGLWDCFNARRAVSLARRAGADTAASLLIGTAMRASDNIIMDDITVCAVDMLPPGCAGGFKEVCREARLARRAAGGGGGFACFCASPVVQEEEQPVSGPTRTTTVLADVDSWVEYEGVREQWSHGDFSQPVHARDSPMLLTTIQESLKEGKTPRELLEGDDTARAGEGAGVLLGMMPRAAHPDTPLAAAIPTLNPEDSARGLHRLADALMDKQIEGAAVVVVA